jgi:FKBP-type peptidyl-prolyl cis-trans isomerase
MKKSAIASASMLAFTLAFAVELATAQSSTTTTKPSSTSGTTTPSTPKTGSKTTPKDGTAAKSGASGALTLKTDKEKASYAIGMNIGEGMRRQSLDIDPAIVGRGLKDAFSDSKTLMSDSEMRATLSAFQTDMNGKLEAKRKQEGEAAQKEGEVFLASNKSKPGVITLPSGLQYKILTTGNGPKPAASDTVVCHYRGTLVNGKEFDSSYKRGEPLTIGVSGVIKGWTEALQLMPVGSKWQLFIPSNLAYGERGAGADIPPNATLIFEVELISILGKK